MAINTLQNLYSDRSEQVCKLIVYVFVGVVFYYGFKSIKETLSIFGN